MYLHWDPVYSAVLCTAGVIPYQEHWKGSLKQKARIMIGCCFFMFLAYPSLRRDFATQCMSHALLKLCSQKFQHASISTLLLLLAAQPASMLVYNYTTAFFFNCYNSFYNLLYSCQQPRVSTSVLQSLLSSSPYQALRLVFPVLTPPLSRCVCQPPYGYKGVPGPPPHRGETPHLPYNG